jgi:hypothetical protein
MTLLLTILAWAVAAICLLLALIIWAACKAAGVSDEVSDRLFRQHTSGQERK